MTIVDLIPGDIFFYEGFPDIFQVSSVSGSSIGIRCIGVLRGRENTFGVVNGGEEYKVPVLYQGMKIRKYHSIPRAERRDKN